MFHFREIFSTSVKTFDDLSRNTKDFEKSISSNVIKYFQELSEDNSLSNIKKTITSLSKDMKANTDRVQNLQEQVNNQTCESTLYRKSMDISNLGSAENKLVNAQLAEENSEKELYTKKVEFINLYSYIYLLLYNVLFYFDWCVVSSSNI